MNGAKHTPGPWVDNVDGVVVVDKPGRWREIIADVHANPLEANNRRANTLLIAAAPDLLEACEAAQEALSALDRVQMYGSADMVRDRAARALTRIESAIAKAEGQS